MAFVPYSIVADRLPKLRAGYNFKVGTKFFTIKETRRMRKRFDEDGAEDKKLWNSDNGVIPYEPLTGALEEKKRIVHLHYISFSTAVDCILWWLAEPLLTKVAQDPLNSDLAGLSTPYEIDKWTYDKTICLSVTKAAGAQTITIEGMEYFVAMLPAPPASFLELTEKGEAIFHGF